MSVSSEVVTVWHLSPTLGWVQGSRSESHARGHISDVPSSIVASGSVGTVPQDRVFSIAVKDSKTGRFSKVVRTFGVMFEHPDEHRRIEVMNRHPRIDQHLAAAGNERRWKQYWGILVLGVGALMLAGIGWLLWVSFHHPDRWREWNVGTFGQLGDSIAPITALASVATFAAAAAAMLLQREYLAGEAQDRATEAKDRAKDQAEGERRQADLTKRQEDLVKAERETAESLKASLQALQKQAEATAKFYSQSNAQALHSTRRARLDEAHARAQRIDTLRDTLEYDLRFVIQHDLDDYTMIADIWKGRAEPLLKEAKELHSVLKADPIHDELLQIEGWIREHENVEEPGKEANRTQGLAKMRERWDSIERRYTRAASSQKPMIKGSEEIEAHYTSGQDD